MQETTAVEDAKDKSITEVAGSGNDDSKVEEPVVKDEKKEKVKKKRSFRSFSFLRREKKTKEENTKNGEVAKEVPLLILILVPVPLPFPLPVPFSATISSCH